MLDPTKFKDWQIAEEAEKQLPPVDYFREKMGLLPDEIIPYGRTPRLDFIKIMNRLKDRPDGKYIEVTAITPTPLGEGKSTTSLGIIEGLGKLGKNVGGCLRQPSGAPTMNVKGTAAGGGNALLIPMTEFLSASPSTQRHYERHQPAMVALNARMRMRQLTQMRNCTARSQKARHPIPSRVSSAGWTSMPNAQKHPNRYRRAIKKALR